jgi:hypothetical protein
VLILKSVLVQENIKLIIEDCYLGADMRSESWCIRLVLLRKIGKQNIRERDFNFFCF